MCRVGTSSAMYSKAREHGDNSAKFSGDRTTHMLPLSYESCPLCNPHDRAVASVQSPVQAQHT